MRGLIDIVSKGMIQKSESLRNIYKKLKYEKALAKTNDEKEFTNLVNQRLEYLEENETENQENGNIEQKLENYEAEAEINLLSEEKAKAYIEKHWEIVADMPEELRNLLRRRAGLNRTDEIPNIEDNNIEGNEGNEENGELSGELSGGNRKSNRRQQNRQSNRNRKSNRRQQNRKSNRRQQNRKSNRRQ